MLPTQSDKEPKKAIFCTSVNERFPSNHLISGCLKTKNLPDSSEPMIQLPMIHRMFNKVEK